MPLTPGAIPVLCARVKDVPPTFVVPPGMKTFPCAGCAVRVLAGPASQKYIAAGHCQPVCEACVPAAACVLVTPEHAAEARALASRAEVN